MDQEFTRHCLELFAPLGAARSRRMFGGQGLYIDDCFVAIIASGQLFLKTDAETRAQFAAAGGGQPFCFEKAGDSTATSYLRPPEEAMESPALMAPWARLAIAAAVRARALKKPKPARKAAPAAGTARRAARRVRAAAAGLLPSLRVGVQRRGHRRVASDLGARPGAG